MIRARPDSSIKPQRIGRLLGSRHKRFGDAAYFLVVLENVPDPCSSPFSVPLPTRPCKIVSVNARSLLTPLSLPPPPPLFGFVAVGWSCLLLLQFPWQFIQCFGCLNVSAMVAIIIYVIVNNVDLGGGNDDPPPDPSS